jgi:hypothetical protein
MILEGVKRSLLTHGREPAMGPTIKVHVCMQLDTCALCEGPVYCCQDVHQGSHAECAQAAHEEWLATVDDEDYIGL